MTDLGQMLSPFNRSRFCSFFPRVRDIDLQEEVVPPSILAASPAGKCRRL